MFALFGWLIPLAGGLVFAYKAATFRPESDVDNWDRVGYDFSRMLGLGAAVIWLALSVVGLMLYLLIAPARQPAGYCQKCGYDLTGNVSGRCPECGDKT